MIDVKDSLRRIKRKALQKMSRKAKRFAQRHLYAPEESDTQTGVTGGGVLSRNGVDLMMPDGPMFEPTGDVVTQRRPREGVQAADVPSDRKSRTGISYTDGLPDNREESFEYRPLEVRGRATGQGHGLFHQLFVSSSDYQRAWGMPLQSLVTGHWEVQPPTLKDPTPAQKEAGERRAAQIENALFRTLEGGWSSFLIDWWYAGIGGFSLFETLYHTAGDQAGLIREMPFVWPSQVDGWLHDRQTQKLEAVRCKDTDGQDFFLEANRILLYSHLAFGDSREGLSPMRSVARWIQAIQIFARLEILSGERFGVPYAVGRLKDPDAKKPNSSGRTKLFDILSQAKAEESPTLTLPDGYVFELVSAAGEMPDWDAPKRFALERIVSRLSAEGSIIAVGDTGAFAAREEATGDALQLASFIAQFLCENVNGASNRRYTGIVKSMEDYRWGGPIQPYRYCQVSWSPGDVRDPKRGPKIVSAVKGRALKPDKHVRRELRKEYDIPLSEELKDDAEQVDAQQQPVEASDSGAGRGALLGAEDLSLRQMYGIVASEVAEAGGVHIQAADLDPEKAASQQDKLEAQLARRLESVATDHKKAYRDRVRRQVESAPSQADAKRAADRAKDDVRQDYLPRYQRAAYEVLTKAKDKGGQDLIRAFGKTIDPQTTIPVDEDIETVIRDEADQIGREAFQRQQGMFDQRVNDMLSGDDNKKLDKLAGSTWAAMAATTVSKPYNLGREAVVKKAKDQTRRRRPGDTVRIIAERSSVLDGGTCDPCEDLDGERALVGSSRYGQISPPNRCAGGGRCRCIFSFILPDERGFEDAVAELKQGA